MSDNSAVLFCNCAYYSLHDPASKETALAFLRSRHIATSFFADLCEAAAEKPRRLQLPAHARRIYVFACSARAVKSLLNYAGIEMEDREIVCVNLREPLGEEYERFKAAADDLPVDPDFSMPESLEQKKEWIPWYPVIDRDHCVNCMQCLNFCLFGVYHPDKNGQVQVANPSACKTNCPACARVCPSNAILFPKHNEPSINGLDQPASEKKHVEDSGNLLEQLQKRNHAVSSPQQTLREMQKKFSIPDEVLHSLTPGEMNELQRRKNKGR